MSKEKHYILGNGQHAKVILSLLAELYNEQPRFIVQNSPNPRELLEKEALTYLQKKDVYLYIGIGFSLVNDNRISAFNRFYDYDCLIPSLIHPSAFVAADVNLQDGVQVMANATIMNGVTIGKNTLINTSSSIDHDCIIGSNVHIAPGNTICGGVIIEDGAFVGPGSVISKGISVGSKAIIGAGSVIVRDVESLSRVIQKK